MKQKISTIDVKLLGRLLCFARKAAGYESCKELVAALNRETGVATSERTLYDVEAGVRLPSFEVFFGMQILMPEILNYEYIKPVFWVIQEKAFTGLHPSFLSSPLDKMDRLEEIVKSRSFIRAMSEAEDQKEWEALAEVFSNLDSEYRRFVINMVIPGLLDIQEKDLLNGKG